MRRIVRAFARFVTFMAAFVIALIVTAINRPITTLALIGLCALAARLF